MTIVDFEAIAVACLKADDAVTELVDEGQIGTRLHRTWQAGIPAIRCSRIGGLPTEDVTAYLQRARLQLESYAATTPEAFAIIAAAIEALRGLPGAAADDVGAVVSAVRQDLGIANVGDNDSDSERYIAGVVIYGHAQPQ